MMLRNKILTIMLGMTIMGCNNTMNKGDVIGSVTSLEEQGTLNGDMVLAELSEGNSRFVKGELHNRNYKKQVELSQEGQFPKSVILSCIDSRVPVETIFDLGIGDAFVARVAGNISNEDILGSLEYATEVSGAKLVVVLGHESCGAVKASKDNVELGNITPLLHKIKPAVDNVEKRESSNNLSDSEIVNEISKENVLLTMENLREESQILKELEKDGKIKIVGGIYEVSSGEVKWIN